MDPEEADKALVRAFSDRSRVDIAEAADSLIGWIEKGGFIPQRLTDAFVGKKAVLWYLRDVRATAEMI